MINNPMRLILYIIIMIVALIAYQQVEAAAEYGNPAAAPGTSTQTPTSGSVTPTITFTPTLTPTVTLTTTLAPLPEITLIFPAFTHTATASATPRLSAVTPTPTIIVDNGQSKLSPRIQFLIVVIIILWLILGVFLVLYFRQFK
jgi:hypothetical protein